MAEYRGDVKGGKNSPFRDRSLEENLDLFRRMKAGECPGSADAAGEDRHEPPELPPGDPIMYRIMHAKHHRTKDKWCIYPMYDYAHGESDSVEGITHSICTLEFEIHRPLYDWYVENIGIYHPQQIEFARLNLTYTVLSKRKLIQLVTEKHVSGWDDPRMPTICGVRRRGYTPEAMRKFCERIGVSKYNGTIANVPWLERCAPRRFEQEGSARDGRASTAEGRHRKLSGRADRTDGRGQQPGGRVGRDW